MKKYMPSLLMACLAGGGLIFSLSSCSGSGGGESDPNKAEIEYRVDTDDQRPECVREIEYIDEDGRVQDERNIDRLPFREDFHVSEGAHLYLQARVDCDRVEVEIEINGDRVARDTSSNRAEVEGYLRRDAAGNWTFEEKE